jgi:predicted lipid-binding transport protein (Tim44 family)
MRGGIQKNKSVKENRATRQIDVGCVMAEALRGRPLIQWMANDLYAKGFSMCEKNDTGKSANPSDETSPIEAAGVGTALGVVVGGLAAGLGGAIFLGLIYGAVAALCAATEHEVNDYDLG